MDYETLKNKRQKNVQEQIFLRKHAIMSTALSFKDGNIPGGILKLLSQKGFSFRNCALVSLDAYPECCVHTFSGIIVSLNHQFFEFEVELDHNETDVLFVEKWTDTTSVTEISDHKKGIGKTFGALAIEVLNEIKAMGDSSDLPGGKGFIGKMKVQTTEKQIGEISISRQFRAYRPEHFPQSALKTYFSHKSGKLVRLIKCSFINLLSIIKRN